jgi:hypothetical protein
VAAGIRADIRAEPRVADNLHVEYTSEEDLDLETKHIMCALCLHRGTLFRHPLYVLLRGLYYNI